jgi:hypothetical protein
VLHPEAGEYFDVAVIHGYWKVNDDFARGGPEQLPQAFIQIELASREIKPRALCLPGIYLLV